MIDSVRRDLEDLLNTHHDRTDLPEEFVEVRNSIVAYGLPDLVSYHVRGTDGDRAISTKSRRSIARSSPG